MSKNSEEIDSNNNNKDLKDAWAIRPCNMYKEEYSDCTSIKARFHQYFVHGESVDCSQWLTDYENCVRYKDSNCNDIKAGAAVVQSEEERRQKRLKAHYANTTWKKRQSPPEDWAKPLPEWLAKKNENTYLEVKANEIAGAIPEAADSSYCLVM
ncbi:UPF0545 protein C22orf39 homolog [Episyrphus balteatus]|uniref:UPF0545 protein C22orf39 homolog n=1 Tax=Episyrphus balteatus TaxID=286459 RepID=UPI002486C15B|nr:UPF0545 protein C22orf39 homolog [Episyrphus balteatus]